MKRMLAVFLSLCLVVYLLPIFALAASYTDPNSGVTFTVPAGWVENPLPNISGIAAAEFYPASDDLIARISFISQDFFYETPPEESATDRTEFDQQYAKNKIIPEYGELPVVSYGGKDYYLHETKQPFSVIYKLFRCENGVEYTFGFVGEPDGPAYKDFLSLVKSAVYPSQAKTSSQVWIIAAIAAAVIVLLVLVVVVLRRKKQKAEPATSENTAVSGVGRAQCPNCGCRVEDNDRFCLECGTPLFPDKP